MKKTLRRLLVRVLLLVLAVQAPALAREPERRNEREDESEESAAPVKQHRLSLELGLGAPLGLMGIGYAFAPYDPLRIELGVGLGYTAPQISLMPQVALGSAHHHYVAGLGIAIGVLDQIRCDPVCPWINVDAAGYEYIASGGFTFLVGAGITVPLSEPHINFWGGGPSRYDILPQIKLGVGWWW